jgi:hypothetical protein
MGMPSAQTLHIGAVGRVGALNLVAQIVHDLGDAAHADAADADEMDRADVERHARGRGSRHHALPMRSTRSARRATRRAWPEHARLRRGARDRPAPRRRSAAWLQASGREVALRDAPACAGFREHIGIRSLVVVQRVRQRHEDRRPADHHQFGDGAGAGATDHEMRVRHARGRSLKNGASSALSRRRPHRLCARLRYLRDGIAARCQTGLKCVRQRANCGRHDFAQRARALAAAEHEQTQRPAGRRLS